MSHVGTVAHGVSEWPRFWSRYAPQRPALVQDDRVESWGELEDRAARLAGGLAAAGIAKGDRVGMLARNAPEFFEVLVACARLGAVFVPFNVRLTGAELGWMAEHSGLSLLVTDATFADRLGAMGLPPERTYFAGPPPEGGRPLDDLLGAPPVTAPDGVTLDDPLILAYTSGTTGYPKAAVITHGNAAATSIAVTNVDGLRPGDRVALPAPLAFAGSVLSIGLPFLHCGGSMLIERDLDPERMLGNVQHRGVTVLKLVPLIYELMAASPAFERTDLTRLRTATAGGAPVPIELLRTYQARGVRLGGAYGLTEGCGFNLQLPAHEAVERIGWTGVPLMFQSCVVVDDDGAEVAPGEVGELTIAGPCVMRGYWDDPAATADAIRDGRLHTGDLVIADEAGYVKVVDRKKDMLISGGLNVYPAEVERVLARHPAVVEVAVVGVPDERWGEAPVACVASRDPALTLDALVAEVADELADYKRPRGLRLLDELPRNSNGKILKRELREAAVAESGGRD